MKNSVLLLFMVFAFSAKAQILETTTLASKGVKGKVNSIVNSYYEFVAEKGLQKSVIEIEKFDKNGNLISISRDELLTGNKYEYTYELDKKGVLGVEKIANGATGLNLRNTKYDYKKGLLATTTQVQGLITTVKNYGYNDKDQLIETEVVEDEEVKGVVYSERDEQNRIIKTSQKLKGEEVVSVISTFEYKDEGVNEITAETRATVNGTFFITTLTDKTTKLKVQETTKNLGNNQQSVLKHYYESDAQGSWIKSEVLDEQFGRSSLVLRKITYADGQTTGRTEMAPEDNRAQYFRQYSNVSVAINGKIVPATSPNLISGTDDYITYVSSINATVILKGYNKSSNHTTWHEGVIVSHNPEDIFWAGGPNYPTIFQKGLIVTTGKYRYDVGANSINYLTSQNKSFLAIKEPEEKPGLKKAELLEDNRFWAKMTDSTYVLVSKGYGVTIRKQLELDGGDKLILSYLGGADGWFILPNYRTKFDEGKPGDIHNTEYLEEPLKQLKERYPSINFSSIVYDNLPLNKYRLKTVDGTVVSGIAETATWAPDKQQVLYFPLTSAYYRLDGFYDKADDKEFANQPLTLLSKGEKSIYYLYNENKNITYFVEGRRLIKSNLGSRKLYADQGKYGAVVYDSTTNASYGMQYDLKGTTKIGPMKALSWNSVQTYIMKFEKGQWVIFEKGEGMSNYDYSLMDGDDVVHFYTNALNVVKAYRFKGFKNIEPGDFLPAEFVPDNEVASLATKLKVDPSKPKEKPVVTKAQPNTFKRIGTTYNLWDGNGEPVVDYLQFFGNLGSPDAYVRDTARSITYELKGYFTQDNIEGSSRIVMGPTDYKVLKWGDKNVAFFINGKSIVDVKRVYVKNQVDSEMWGEVIYDRHSGSTFLAEYPQKEGFYFGALNKLLADNEKTVLVKQKDGKFTLIVEGVIDKSTTFTVDIYQGDLIYVNNGTSQKAYRFKGFEKAEYLDLLFPEVIPQAELKTILNEIDTAKTKGGKD
ncbi:hypothetical protein [Roseivirga echinicomitans]|uniref:Uncharacterized protein n=1 Tax=Roseivirga echinicomitans TaxID=296218 RepID=A0A150XJT9_9BACT|nr:hypothetical protein [Roseivirga echinicomitans]KYG78976.1 hypothetical protein AWN68_04925 [Roseivirga echinicomitans]